MSFSKPKKSIIDQEKSLIKELFDENKFDPNMDLIPKGISGISREITPRGKVRPTTQGNNIGLIMSTRNYLKRKSIDNTKFYNYVSNE